MSEVQPAPTFEVFPVGRRKNITVAGTDHLRDLESYREWFQDVARIPGNHRVTWQRFYIVQHFRPRPGDRILDIGAYIGNNLLRYAKEGHQVDGIEIGTAYCETWENRRESAVASGEMTQEQADRTKMHNCAFEEWQSDNPYTFCDAILICETLEHVIDPAAFVRKAARHLDPGGFLFIATPKEKTRTAVREVTTADLRTWIARAGLEVEKMFVAIPRKRDDGPSDWGVAQWICIARKEK